MPLSARCHFLNDCCTACLTFVWGCDLYVLGVAAACTHAHHMAAKRAHAHTQQRQTHRALCTRMLITRQNTRRAAAEGGLRITRAASNDGANTSFLYGVLAEGKYTHTHAQRNTAHAHTAPILHWCTAENRRQRIASALFGICRCCGDTKTLSSYLLRYLGGVRCKDVTEKIKLKEARHINSLGRNSLICSSHMTLYNALISAALTGSLPATCSAVFYQFGQFVLAGRSLCAGIAIKTALAYPDISDRVFAKR